MITLQEMMDKLKYYNGEPVQFMEVCGTHTNSIFKHGIPGMLSKNIKLISGPGCPVCVTSGNYIDRAAEISMKENTVLYTFGDMIKVPGYNTSLSAAKAKGGRVEIMYSPFDVLNLAIANPSTTFVIAAVGFETTTPIYALLLDKMIKNDIHNIHFLTALKTIVPALEWICGSNPNIDGFIGPGHVSAILGYDIYKKACSKCSIPMAVAGFEAEEIIAAIYDLLIQSERKTSDVHNLYASVVTSKGNPKAISITDKYFQAESASWRGLGSIEGSGLFLRNEYSEYDEDSRSIGVDEKQDQGCRCGEVIIGKVTPDECPWFANECTPSTPHGPCMVSIEGTCGIWFRNGVKKTCK